VRAGSRGPASGCPVGELAGAGAGPAGQRVDLEGQPAARPTRDLRVLLVEAFSREGEQGLSVARPGSGDADALPRRPRESLIRQDSHCAHESMPGPAQASRLSNSATRRSRYAVPAATRPAQLQIDAVSCSSSSSEKSSITGKVGLATDIYGRESSPLLAGCSDRVAATSGSRRRTRVFGQLPQDQRPGEVPQRRAAGRHRGAP
jgi:hypothetical protein